MANKKQVVDLSTGKSETKTLTAAEELKKTQDEALSASKEEVSRPRRVKLEAKRRIIAVYPRWKQRNLTARGVELVKIRVLVGSWTVDEQTEVDAIQAVWDWVKSVRTSSDALEAQNPVPVDFTDDKHWPPK